MLEIGRGREAKVYVVVKRDLKSKKVQFYALRVLHAKQTERPGAAHRLRLCALPANPHVVRILQSDACTGVLQLEYVGGGTLADELVCADISKERAVEVIKHVLRGVAHLHEHRFVHGDVSPSNVLISESGDCKLTDYFVEPTGCLDVCGAPAYMAPEAARGKVVHASDVWSVGCLMLAVSGRPPWQDAEVLLEDGSVVDLNSSCALLFHLACREIALRGPPEFAACDDGVERLFFGVLGGIFTTVERRVSAHELLVDTKRCYV
jgi:serine/threonine protein kinase